MIGIPVPHARTVTTGLGRVVGYYQFGVPTGRPVIALHGTPECGAGFAFADAAAAERDIRLLAPDRPGVGDSDRARQGAAMSVADYPPDLFTFADALGIERFSVLGYSGGGPYALAAAHADPRRVRAVGIVAGAGQVGRWATLRDYDVIDRLLSRVARRAPWAARFGLAVAAGTARRAPRVALRAAEVGMGTADRAVIDRNFATPRAALALFTEAFRHGPAGVVDDYAALARPWGFPVEAIEAPVRCWHGTADTVVPVRHSDALAALVPRADVVRWPGDGHLAFVEHAGEVLDGLIELAGQERDFLDRTGSIGAADACASGEMGAR